MYRLPGLNQYHYENAHFESRARGLPAQLPLLAGDGAAATAGRDAPRPGLPSVSELLGPGRYLSRPSFAADDALASPASRPRGLSEASWTSGWSAPLTDMSMPGPAGTMRPAPRAALPMPPPSPSTLSGPSTLSSAASSVAAAHTAPPALAFVFIAKPTSSAASAASAYVFNSWPLVCTAEQLGWLAAPICPPGTESKQEVLKLNDQWLEGTRASFRQVVACDMAPLLAQAATS